MRRLVLVLLAGAVGCASTELPRAPSPTVATSPPADASPPDATVAPASPRVGTDPGGAGRGTPLVPKPGHALAAFAGGCFWSLEPVFRALPGVTATAVGFAGGHTSEPTYAEVLRHGTGHAETVLVEFDPTKIAYAELVRAFLRHVDPTAEGHQGQLWGSNYRTAIFFFSPEQDRLARAALADEQKLHASPIVTETAPMGPFWRAEEEHQQFAEKHGGAACPTGAAPPSGI